MANNYFIVKHGLLAQGPVILDDDPVLDLGAATKQYVDKWATVQSVNNRQGDVVIISQDVTDALGYIPFDEKGGDITGSVVISDNLGVDGNVVINGTLFVREEVIFRESLSINKNLNVGLDLDVLLDAAIHGNASIDGDLSVFGHTTLHGDAFVKGMAFVEGNVRMESDVTIQGDTYIKSGVVVDQNASIGGDAGIHGDAFVDGDIGIIGNIQVDGGGRITGELEVGDDTHLKGDVFVDGALFVQGEITGNASSATKLRTPRAINGTLFDGTEDISFGTDSVEEESNLYFTHQRSMDSSPIQTVLGRTGDITFDFNDITSSLGYEPVDRAGDTMTGKLIMGESIEPNQHQEFDLGSSENNWDNGYLKTLFINNKKVISDTPTCTLISTDNNNSLKVKSSGSGKLTLETNSDIILNGDVIVSAGKSIVQEGGDPLVIGSDIDITNHTISNLAYPEENDQAANKQYVDDLTIHSTEYVRVTGNQSINGEKTFEGTVKVNGALVVAGGSLEVISEVVNISDNIIELNSNVTSGQPLEDSGFHVRRGDLGVVGFIWDETNDRFVMVDNENSPALDLYTTGTITATTLVGELQGNAASATRLKTARTINGVSFNGTANISFTTDSVAEGSTNLYFTEQRSMDASPIQKVFGRTGNITLLSSDVTGALGYVPVNKAGDTITGALTVTGNTTVGAILSVTGNTSIGGNTTIVGTANISSEATFQDNVHITGNTDISGKLDIMGELRVSNSTSITNDLSVGGSTSLTGQLTLNDDAIIAGNISIAGSASVVGSITTNDELVVDKDATVKGSITVIQNAQVGGILTVDSNAVVKGGMSIDGDTHIKGGLDVDLDTTLNGDLLVVGSHVVKGGATIEENVKVLGGLSVDLNTNLAGDLLVEGNASVANDFSVLGDTNVVGNVLVDGGANIGGEVQLGSNVTVSGDLSVDGETQLGGKLHAMDDAIVEGSLSIITNLNVGGTMSVTGKVSVSDDLAVGGALTVDEINAPAGILTIAGDTTFTGELTLGTILASNGALNIAGETNITGKTSITGDASVSGGLTVVGEITGNASSATKLKTPRTINGVAFDGTANISFSTNAVAEGSNNLYFTNDRAKNAAPVQSVVGRTGNVTLDVDDVDFALDKRGDTVEGELDGTFFNVSVSPTVSAAGTTKATARQLSSAVNVITSGTGGVILPQAKAGKQVVIINELATSVNVYSFGSASIEDIGTNSPLVLGGKTRLTFVAVSNTKWYAMTAVFG